MRVSYNRARLFYTELEGGGVCVRLAYSPWLRFDEDDFGQHGTQAHGRTTNHHLTKSDAAAAVKIMQFVSDLAKQENLIIVCSVHQPSSAIYACFDKVLAECLCMPCLCVRVRVRACVCACVCVTVNYNM